MTQHHFLVFGENGEQGCVKTETLASGVSRLQQSAGRLKAAEDSQLCLHGRQFSRDSC